MAIFVRLDEVPFYVNQILQALQSPLTSTISWLRSVAGLHIIRRSFFAWINPARQQGEAYDQRALNKLAPAGTEVPRFKAKDKVPAFLVMLW